MSSEYFDVYGRYTYGDIVERADALPKGEIDAIINGWIPLIDYRAKREKDGISEDVRRGRSNVQMLSALRAEMFPGSALETHF